MKDEQKERDLLSELELLKDVSKQLVQEHDRVVKEFDRIHHELERIRKHPQPKASLNRHAAVLRALSRKPNVFPARIRLS